MKSWKVQCLCLNKRLKIDSHLCLSERLNWIGMDGIYNLIIINLMFRKVQKTVLVYCLFISIENIFGAFFLPVQMS